MPKNDPAVKVTRFLGVNNTDDPVDLGVDESGSGWLVGAQDMDITNTGKTQRRPGFAIIAGYGAVTSAYATKDERDLFTVNSGTLYRVHTISPLARTAIDTGLASSELYWAEAGNLTFFCGSSKGIITGNEVLPFGIDAAEAPGMTEIEGSLPAGRYLAACVFQDAYGRQGGCSGLSEIEITEGGITFDAPTLADHTTLLYVSRVNGESLFLLAEITTTAYSWYGVEPTSIPLDDNQIGGYPPPENSECIAFHESKIWVSEYDQATNISYIHPSKPFWYYLFPLDQYIPVPGKVLMLASVPSELGAVLLIGTDEAIYIYNEVLIEVADFGVVPGHQIKIVGRKAYFWTQEGACSAMPFQQLTHPSYSVPPGSRAGVGLRRYNGMDTLIIGTNTSGDAVNPRGNT